MALNLGVDVVVIQVLIVVNEGLAHQVISRIVEVFSGEGGLVNTGKSRVAFAQHVLFDQLHNCALLLGLDAWPSHYSTGVRALGGLCQTRQRYAPRKKMS